VSTSLRILALETIAVEEARRSAYRALSQIAGCEVHLMVPAAWQEQGEITRAEPEPDPRVHLHISKTWFGYRQHRVLYRALRKVLNEVQPDILYADTEPENYTAAQCRLALDAVSPRTRLALVSSRNLDYPTIGFPYKFAVSHRWCDSLVLRRPVDIMFVRPRSTLHMLDRYATRVVHLPHPVDNTLFSPDAVPAFPATGGIQTVGYIGRLAENKGVRILIESIVRMPENVRVLIVGRGPAREALESQVAALGLTGRVRFAHAVRYTEVPGIIRSMDVLVLPSLPDSYWIEQFGRVLIEAMACGVPIVASSSGEIPHVLGSSGILVKPGDAGELTSALSDLLGDPLRRKRMGEEGRARAIQEFSARTVAGIMHSTFMSCL
jgi:glycosyltransferase involved in cell wall biosynthesis